jgi:WD40 repeat protein
MENSSLAFSGDRTLLVAGSRHGRISLWEVATGKRLRTVGREVPFETVVSLSFSGDSKTLASCSLNEPFRLWDVATGKELLELPPGVMVFSATGQRFASWGPADNTISIRESATGQERRLEGHSQEITSVAFSRDGKTLASVSRDHSLRIWDVDSGRQRFRIAQITGCFEYVVFSPDGRLLASVPGPDNRIQLWDSATGKETVR